MSRDHAWHAPWLEVVRAATTAGKEIRRARIGTVPHSDYTRWSLANTPLNIEAGEAVRWLPRHGVGDVELPSQDFCLFDDEQVVWTPFDVEGRYLGSSEERDPRLISLCRSACAGMWAVAIPHRDYR